MANRSKDEVIYSTHRKLKTLFQNKQQFKLQSASSFESTRETESLAKKEVNQYAGLRIEGSYLSLNLSNLFITVLNFTPHTILGITISLGEWKKTDMHLIDLIRGSSMQVRQNLTGVPEPDIRMPK